MTDFKALSTSVLLSQILVAKQKECEATVMLLRYLREVNRRRLFLELGYSSLFEFVTKYLGYSEGAAYRRVSALKLSDALPEVEQKIEAGTLSLTTAAQVQSLLRAEKMQPSITSKVSQSALVSMVENKSKLEVTKILLDLNPQNSSVMPKEKQRIVSPEVTELKILADPELMQLIQRAKELEPEAAQAPSLQLIFKKALKGYLKQRDPMTASKKQTLSKAESKTFTSPEKVHISNPSDLTYLNSKSTKSDGKILKDGTATTFLKKNHASKFVTSPAKVKPLTHSRYIPKQLKQKIWSQDQSQCSFVSPITQRRCTSRQCLQIHHKEAFAKGGPASEENLTLLCAQHNRHLAIQEFGVQKVMPL